MMKLDDLKQNWQQQVKPCHSSDNLKEVIAMLEKQTKKIDREVKYRDILEISIALLLIPFWLYGLVNSAGTMQSIGLIIALVTSVFIPYRMLKARKVTVEKSDSIKTYLLTEQQKLRQQKEMLENIVWWYIAPITLAVILITLGATVDQYGMPQLNQSLIIYYGALALLVVGIYLLNKRAAKKKFAPLLEKIEQRLTELTCN